MNRNVEPALWSAPLLLIGVFFASRHEEPIFGVPADFIAGVLLGVLVATVTVGVLRQARKSGGKK